ncbi:FadR/GntR family transcriptional regulator [Loktanella sp. DJP18]|uniref:FadR/GntR family transcriptional regulator n=1 Tax=Loktanella sp. DJP18 TaxID=3409788 RepID=UPI003BB48F8F
MTIGQIDDDTIGQPNRLDGLRQWVNHHDIGTRMPPERKLAETLSISRPALRKALAVLEAEGRILRQVGRGTFITRPPATTYAGLAALTARTSPYDAMMARLVLEPELANLAALHATSLDIRRLRTLADDLRQVGTWDDYERLDHALHDLIAQSAGNGLLHELHMIMNAVRQVVVWRQLSSGVAGPAPDYHSFDEHDAIVTAIAARDGTGAKHAMQAHLRTTLQAMTTGH